MTNLFVILFILNGIVINQNTGKIVKLTLRNDQVVEKSLPKLSDSYIIVDELLSNDTLFLSPKLELIHYIEARNVPVEIDGLINLRFLTIKPQQKIKWKLCVSSQVYCSLKEGKVNVIIVSYGDNGVQLIRKDDYFSVF